MRIFSLCMLFFIQGWYIACLLSIQCLIVQVNYHADLSLLTLSIKKMLRLHYNICLSPLFSKDAVWPLPHIFPFLITSPPIKQFPSNPTVGSHLQYYYVNMACFEYSVSYYVGYFGYVMFLQALLLITVDNFWLNWGPTKKKLGDFIRLVQTVGDSSVKRSRLNRFLRSTEEKPTLAQMTQEKSTLAKMTEEKELAGRARARAFRGR